MNSASKIYCKFKGTNRLSIMNDVHISKAKKI